MSYIVPRDKPSGCYKCPFMDKITYDCKMMYSNAYPDFESQYENCPLVEIIWCKDCKHKPIPTENYDSENLDCGYELVFPDHRCPCQCDDGFYSWIPDDDWTCGFAERKKGKAEAKERKTGRWIKENIVLTSCPPQYQWHCSECGKKIHGFTADVLTDFCPNCGARMEVDHE